MRVLDLFSGIGGFSLGLERAGMTTAAFCEIEPFCRRVLAKHWPNVPIYDDVRELSAARLAADGIGVDVICGGFPCQDISIAGKAAGLDGERSGLWREYARLVGELRPRFVIVENVAALLGRGLGDVLGDLAALGYDAEWHCIPASHVGAPHERDRLWVVAYADNGQRAAASEAICAGRHATGSGRLALAHPDRPWQEMQRTHGRVGRQPLAGEIARCVAKLGDRWGIEPDVGRVVDGLPAELDGPRRARLRALGNAVVPAIPEVIGRAILETA
jgi:DNA (cytosine-5)-methyltransferase 1